MKNQYYSLTVLTSFLHPGVNWRAHDDGRRLAMREDDSDVVFNSTFSRLHVCCFFTQLSQTNSLALVLLE